MHHRVDIKAQAKRLPQDSSLSRVLWMLRAGPGLVACQAKAWCVMPTSRKTPTATTSGRASS